MSCTCDHGFRSRVESSIVHAVGEPATVNIANEVTVSNETGLLVNKEEEESFSGPVPLEQYPINHDSCPTIYQKRPNCVECQREVSIKYLEPGSAPTPGAIVINQEQNILAPYAPPGSKRF